MAKFIVLHTPILHDGKRYEVGQKLNSPLNKLRTMRST